MTEPVGRVVGTTDATPLTFSVALGRGRVTSSSTTSWCAPASSPTTRPSRSPASSVRSRLATRAHASTPTCSSSRTASSPRRRARSPRSSRTRSSPRSSCRRCPAPRSTAPREHERDQALYFDQMEAKLPIGVDHRDEPLYLNLEFLDGTRGAHVNISGISGVATKTTYATFLLYSLFNSGVLGAEAINTKALIFNVKGEDLLFLDHANIRLADKDRERYRRMGLEPNPFDSVAVYGSPRKNDPNMAPDIATRTLGTHTYYWTHRRVRRAGAPRLLVRRRRGRAPAVHDGDPQRRRPAQERRPAPRRRRHVVDRRRRDLDVRRARRLHLRPRRGRGHPRALGGTGHDDGHGERVHPPAARGATSARTSDPRRREAASRPSDPHVGREGHRRRPPQPSTTGPSASSSAPRSAARSTRRKRRARHVRCCSSCSTS